MFRQPISVTLGKSAARVQISARSRPATPASAAMEWGRTFDVTWNIAPVQKREQICGQKLQGYPRGWVQFCGKDTNRRAGRQRASWHASSVLAGPSAPNRLPRKPARPSAVLPEKPASATVLDMPCWAQARARPAIVQPVRRGAGPMRLPYRDRLATLPVISCGVALRDVAAGCRGQSGTDAAARRPLSCLLAPRCLGHWDAVDSLQGMRQRYSARRKETERGGHGCCCR